MKPPLMAICIVCRRYTEVCCDEDYGAWDDGTPRFTSPQCVACCKNRLEHAAVEAVLDEIRQRFVSEDRIDEVMADIEAVVPSANDLSLNQIRAFLTTHPREVELLSGLLSAARSVN